MPGSTGCRNGTDSTSWRYIFSNVGIRACRSSSGLNTDDTKKINVLENEEVTGMDGKSSKKNTYGISSFCPEHSVEWARVQRV